MFFFVTGSLAVPLDICCLLKFHMHFRMGSSITAKKKNHWNFEEFSFKIIQAIILIKASFNMKIASACDFKTYLYYLVVAALGLCCCAWAFPGCGEQGLPCAVCRLLIARLLSPRGWGSRACSVVTAHRLHCPEALPRGTWDLTGPGFEPMSPKLANRFLISGSPGKSCL